MPEYDEKLIAYSQEEKQSITEVQKDIDKNIEVLFDVQFAEINRINAEEFFVRVTEMLKTVNNHIQQVEYDINKWLSEKSKHVKIGEKVGITKDDPNYKAVLDMEEAVKNFAASITYRSQMLKILIKERKKLLELIKAVKDVEMEKQKSDLAKDMYGDVLKKTNENNDKLINQFEKSLEAERIHSRELLVLVDGLSNRFGLNIRTKSKEGLQNGSEDTAENEEE